MQRLMLCLLMVHLSATACNKEKSEATAEEETTPPPVNSAEQKPVAQETVSKKEPVKKEPEVTCDSLGIPSYDLWIRELSALRCESCHNDKLAFNGIKFLTYEDYQTYAVQAKNRVASNMLSKPLDPIEQGIFLAWFENGMPRTENDCVNKD